PCPVLGHPWLTNADRSCRSGPRFKPLVTSEGSNATNTRGVHALTKSHRPHRDDVDLPTLGHALWKAKGWILGLALGAGAITFVALSMMRPLYTSESRILIQNDESAFTRPTEDTNRTLQQQTLDEQAVQSQVQVITSRDLALDTIKALDLTNNPDFAKDEG